MFNRGEFEAFGHLPPEGNVNATRVYSFHYYDALATGVKRPEQYELWLPSLVGVLMSLQQEAMVRGDEALQTIVDRLVATHKVP